MEKPLLTSTSNPLIKSARALRQRKARVESGQFLVEGIHHVGEAVEAGWKIEAVLYAPEILASEFGRTLLTRVREKGISLQPVSARVMESLSGKENPAGILAVVRERFASLEQVGVIRSGVALVSPQDPGNVGTILRSLDAAGVEALFLLDGGVDPFHPTSVRASMGAIFWKPLVPASFAELVEWAHRIGFQIVGTSAHAPLGYRSFEPKRPFLLIMGSEQKGLSDHQMTACDATVSLPMYGRASSLNLAVATGILLYQFMGNS